MKRILSALLTLAVMTAPALATREPTVPPVYYLIDYGQGHLDSPEYVEWISELPPDLLHFGKDVPMTHLYGPIVAVGGENQAHGRNRDDIRRLTPAEVHERIATLQRMNDALHAAGIGDGGFDKLQRDAAIAVLRGHAGVLGDDGARIELAVGQLGLGAVVKPNEVAPARGRMLALDVELLSHVRILEKPDDTQIRVTSSRSSGKSPRSGRKGCSSRAAAMSLKAKARLSCCR